MHGRTSSRSAPCCTKWQAESGRSARTRRRASSLRSSIGSPSRSRPFSPRCRPRLIGSSANVSRRIPTRGGRARATSPTNCAGSPKVDDVVRKNRFTGARRTGRSEGSCLTGAPDGLRHRRIRHARPGRRYGDRAAPVAAARARRSTRSAARASAATRLVRRRLLPEEINSRASGLTPVVRDSQHADLVRSAQCDSAELTTSPANVTRWDCGNRASLRRADSRWHELGPRRESLYLLGTCSRLFDGIDGIGTTCFAVSS